jgi:DNA-3-methyladenine glycosylase II
MKTFGIARSVPVRTPFRLDLTVDALRRLASNVVDVVAADTYYRALRDEYGTAIVALRQPDSGAIEIRATGEHADRWVATATRMLGADVDLAPWYARSRRIAWLWPLTRAFMGLKPPRYPTLWEACAHAILFQQISIHAAAAIMRRVVETIGEPVTAESVRCIPFPDAGRWLEASDADLRAAGLSNNKLTAVRTVAAATLDGTLDPTAFEMAPTEEIARRLCAVRGLGAWSASVILLRGLGRLDAFPLRDSGVARSLTALAGQADVDQIELLARLGATRGMLYYHLLLGRMRGSEVKSLAIEVTGDSKSASSRRRAARYPP